MSEQELNLSPTRPYMARAIYEWICDNQLTPYLLVDATQPNTMVPEQFIQDGQITLNLVPHAVHALNMSNDAITFSARFGGVSRDLYVPFSAVLGSRVNASYLAVYGPNDAMTERLERDFGFEKITPYGYRHDGNAPLYRAVSD